MGELTTGMNWLAVITGTVVSFLLGWLWYSPKLFGTKWAQGSGVSMDDSEFPKAAMVTQLVGTFLLAWLIGLTATTNALLTAILIVLTIVFFVVAAGLYVKKSRNAVLIEAGFILVMAVIMIVFQGIF